MATLQARNEQADEVLEQLQEQLVTEDKELARIKREKSLLFDLLRDGDIDRDIYNDRLFLLRKDEATVQKVRAGVEGDIRSHQHAHADVEDVRALVALVKRGLPLVSTADRREFLEALEVTVRADKHTVRISGLLQEAILSMMMGADPEGQSAVGPDHTLKHGVVYPMHTPPSFSIPFTVDVALPIG